MGGLQEKTRTPLRYSDALIPLSSEDPTSEDVKTEVNGDVVLVQTGEDVRVVRA